MGPINKNNYPLGNTNVFIFIGMAAVLVTLSSMERLVKHKHVNFNVLNQGFKDCGNGQKVLVYILSFLSFDLDTVTI